MAQGRIWKAVKKHKQDIGLTTENGKLQNKARWLNLFSLFLLIRLSKF